MDFSKYKKTKQDKESTTMSAPGGHTITLIHAKLPRIQVEQLKRLKMADGGDPGAQDASSDQDATPGTNITINAAPAAQAPTSGVPPTVARPVPYQASPDMPNSAGQNGPNTVQFQPPAIPAAMPNVSPSGTMNPGAVMQNAQQAEKSQGAIEGAKAQANAALQSSAVSDIAQNAAQISNNYNQVKGHVDDYADYMRNHPIDAQNYFKQMDPGQKVATSLGLLLGGFTQGFHGGANPASDWLNSQINRDIDAQKSNQQGQASILGAYKGLYGDSVAAQAATRASLADLYAQKASLVGLQLGTPQAQVNAQKFGVAAALYTSKALQDAAVNISTLPGARNPQGGAGNAPAVPSKSNPALRGQDTVQQEYDENHILTPNANLDNVRYTPKLKEQLPAITEQFNQARQSEKALQAVNQVFPKLRDESTLSGWFSSHVNPNALAAVGAGAGALTGGFLGAGATLPVGGAGGIPGAAIGAGEGAAIGKGGGELLKQGLGATGGQKQVQFEADKASLTKILAAALRGTNVNSDQIQEIVDAATPSYSDNLTSYNKKLGIIRDFIKQNTPTSLLEDPSVGLVKRPK